jgi:hypothetical protein
MFAALLASAFASRAFHSLRQLRHAGRSLFERCSLLLCARREIASLDVLTEPSAPEKRSIN